MVDAEGINGHRPELPWLAFLEIMTAAAELEVHTIIAVNTVMDDIRRKDRQAHLLTQRTYGTYVISVVVRDENAHNIGEIELHLLQVLLYVASRYTGINQHTLTARTEIVAVTTTATGETPEYESILLHVTKNCVQRYCFFCIYANKNVTFSSLSCFFLLQRMEDIHTKRLRESISLLEFISGVELYTSSGRHE